MWMFTVHGFFSAVKDQKDKSLVKVRARRKEHLENLRRLFPTQLEGIPIIETQDTDYAFRLILKHEVWNQIVLKLSEEVDYSNFKAAVREVDGPTLYERVLHRVWTSMAAIQPTAPFFGQKNGGR